MIKGTVRFGLVLTLLTATQVMAEPPEGSTTGAADAQELRDYRLTAATMQKVETAGRNLIAALEADPALKARTAAEAELLQLEEKDERTEADLKRMDQLSQQLGSEPYDLNVAPDSGESLSEIAARLEKIPPMAQALKSAGLAPREFIKFSLVVFQTMFVHEMQKAGQLKTVPPEISAENLKFVSEHEAEIMRMANELQEVDE